MKMFFTSSVFAIIVGVGVYVILTSTGMDTASVMSSSNVVSNRKLTVFDRWTPILANLDLKFPYFQCTSDIIYHMYMKMAIKWHLINIISVYNHL